MQHKIFDNRYEIERKIGEGGMARVYLARDQRLNRPVAVKILHSHYTDDPDFLSRFRHEAQAAAILSHPHVVDVYDVGQEGDVHYMVMEYVNGTDLKSIINRDAPLPVERAVEIAEEVAKGLEAAHRVGLIHRDIKPQNIMVSPDGHARITDFGVAKSSLSTAMTETGITFGTVDYISPEQAQGLPATPRSDVYSLGVTLFEMLTGQLPFAGDNALSVAMQHVTTPPPSLRRLNPQVPAQLEALVLKALAKDQKQRFESAQEFARQLHAFRTSAQQETVYNPHLARRLPTDAPQPRPAANGKSGSYTTVRAVPMRPAVAKAPRDSGQGCGVFFVGMLVLAGVMALVLLISSGALSGMFAFGTQAGQRPTATATAAPTATPTPSPSPVPTALVPNLTNLTNEDAQRLLQGANLTPVTQTANSDTIQSGQVISQSISPNTPVRQGDPITYTVSLGPLRATVRDYTGIGQVAADQLARSDGWQVGIVAEPSLSVPEGTIIRQSPAPGQQATPGSPLTLFVSVGDKVRFPNVIGLSREEAERILGINPDLTLEFVDEQGRDRVPDFDDHFPGKVLSATANGTPVRNGDFIPRGSRIVIGVRGP
ncbi:MAG: Stk1 family PASTA domain-containing Ser/Thr kinase [Chloroflexaceae bacterium]|jgi:serine/threonine-protein kinase|nr:Stk1 family PASTA domain-containing Ser/Thr kinase [Chloroflexaceae bacterium]